MIKELRKLESQGLITLRAHDELPLWIANYTPEVSYERLWDTHPLLKQCRGLVVDSDGEVVARPFKKFFNIEEHREFDSLEDIPYGEYHKVYNKLDGSLGIIFWYNGKWRVATRGSFHSEQADKARELLKNYETEKMDKYYTYLVEVIYPENRIVVNYGDREELVMVAKIHTETGKEPMELSSLHESNVFPIVEEEIFTINSLEKHRDKLDFSGEEKEGYVVHFESGLRIKIKLDDYVRLHRLMTGLTARKIWGLLKEGEDIDELYKTAPDEVYKWIDEKRKEILTKKVLYTSISLDLYNSIKRLADDGCGNIDRKKFALAVQSNQTIKNLNLSSIMFSLLDNKDIEQKIWDLIKPEHETINT